MSAVWTCPRVPPSVPDVSDLLQISEPAGRNSGRHQSELVSGGSARDEARGLGGLSAYAGSWRQNYMATEV